MKALNPSLFDDQFISLISDCVLKNKLSNILLSNNNTFDLIVSDVIHFFKSNSPQNKDKLSFDIAKALFFIEVLCVLISDQKDSIKYHTDKLLEDFEIHCNLQ